MLLITSLLLFATCASGTNEERSTFRYGHIGEGILAAGHFHEHEMVLGFIQSLMAQAEDSVGADASFDYSPVIFIPGMTGAVLEAELVNKKDTPNIVCSSNSDWYVLYAGTNIDTLDWKVLSIMLPVTYECTFDNMQMKYVAETGRLWPKDGVHTRVKGAKSGQTTDFDEDHPTEHIGDITADLHFGQANWGMAAILKTVGYQDNLNLWHAPYDFRKSPIDFVKFEYVQLKALTEFVYMTNGNKKVAYIGISMGGPYLSSFMAWNDDAWKEQYVESIITFSGVYGGAMYNLGSLIFGETYGIPYIDAGVFQQMYKTWGCSTWLTPMEGAEHNKVVIEVEEEDGTITDYRVNDLYKFYESVPSLSIAADMKKNFFNEQHRVYQPYHDPGVKTHCMFSANSPTPQKFHLKRNAIHKFDAEANEKNRVSGDYVGDGVANYEELAICRDWAKARVWEYENFSHGTEQGNPGHLRYVLSILHGKGNDSVDCKKSHFERSTCSNDEKKMKCEEGWVPVSEKEKCGQSNDWICSLTNSCTSYHVWCVKEDWWMCTEGQKCGENKDSCFPIVEPVENAKTGEANFAVKDSGDQEKEAYAFSSGECERFAKLRNLPFEFRQKARHPTGCSQTTIQWDGYMQKVVVYQREDTHAKCSKENLCVTWKLPTADVEEEVGFPELQLADTYRHKPRNKFHYGHVTNNMLAAGYFHEHEMYNPNFMKELMKISQKPVGTAGFDWTPVIFIPGMTGSKIEAKLENKEDAPLIICHANTEWYVVYAGANIASLDWMGKLIMAPEVYKCTMDNMKMQFSKLTGQIWPKDGVETRILGQDEGVSGFNPKAETPYDEIQKNFGEIGADLHWGSSGLRAGLLAHGYTDYVDLWHAPYDFRKGPLDFAVKEWPRLKNLTEHVYNLNNRRKVAFVGISMAGPYLSGFLIWSDQAWKDKYVESIITLAGVFGGAIQNLGTMIYGETYGIPYIDNNVFRDMYKTWGCGTWLSSMEGFDDDRVLVRITDSDAGTVKEYKPNQLKDLFATESDWEYAALMKSTYYNVEGDNSKSVEYARAYNDPGVKSHCLYNRDTPTLGTIALEKSKMHDYDTTVTEANLVHGGYTGDGVSQYVELAACRDWNSKKIWEYTGFPHGSEMGNAEHLNYIGSILAGKGESAVSCSALDIVQSECQINPECPEGFSPAGEPESCSTGNFFTDLFNKNMWCYKQDLWICAPNKKCGETKDECLDITYPTSANTEVRTSGDACDDEVGDELSIAECENYAALVNMEFEMRMDMDHVRGCSEAEVTWRGSTTKAIVYNKVKDKPSEKSCFSSNKCICFTSGGSASADVEEEIAEVAISTVETTKRHFEIYLAIFALGALLGAWQFTGTKKKKQGLLFDEEI